MAETKEQPAPDVDWSKIDAYMNPNSLPLTVVMAWVCLAVYLMGP